MKKSIFLATLLVSLMFVSDSYAEWKKIGTDSSGNTYYLDIDKIKKTNGHINYWQLINLSKPTDGYLSARIHLQGNCESFRFKNLTFHFYKKPMGKGAHDTFTTKDNEWENPQRNSPGGHVIEAACIIAE